MCSYLWENLARVLAKVLAGTVFSMASVEEHALSLTQTFSVTRTCCIQMYFSTRYVLIWDENTERWMWANLSQCWGCARVLAPRRAWSSVWPLARRGHREQILRPSFSFPGQIRLKSSPSSAFTTSKPLSGPVLLTPDRYARKRAVIHLTGQSHASNHSVFRRGVRTCITGKKTPQIIAWLPVITCTNTTS